MILNIDTTQHGKIEVQVYDNRSKIKDLLSIEQKPGSQTLLLAIDKILKKHKKTLSDVKSVKVNTGPGSFTGTRVGVSVANALGFALGVSVNGSPHEAGKKAKIALPIYEKSKFDAN